MADVTAFKGTASFDDRGWLVYANEFDPAAAGIKRFYTVANHRQGSVRAWHGHAKSDTYLWVLQGIWKIAAVSVAAVDDAEEAFLDGKDDWKTEPAAFYSATGYILRVPAGYYHGHQNLSEGALLGVFSTATIDEVKDDDLRLEWDHWPEMWKENPR